MAGPGGKTGSSPSIGATTTAASAKSRRGAGISNAPTVADLAGPAVDSNESITSVETAIAYLASLGRLKPGATRISIEDACNTLLWVSTVKGAAVQAAIIRSVVFLLKDYQTLAMAEGLVAVVERKIDDLMLNVKTRLDEAVGASVPPPSSAPQAWNTGVTAPSIDDGVALLSYAAVASRNLPPQHSNVVERSVARRRQVVIHCSALSAEGVSGPPLSEKELVVKAVLAYEGLSEDARADAPEGLTFRGARKLKGEMVAYDMDSPSSADWLKQEDVMNAFLARYDGGQSSFKVTAYYVLAEFVPVAFAPHDPVPLRTVERNSGLPQYAILAGRWIKPAARRPPSQRVAHAILHMRDPDTANHAIRHGLNIEGKTVRVRKLLQDPKRCLRCQRFTPAHLAAACTAQHEVCGTCAGAHSTADCTVPTNDWDSRRCVNCNTNGHASWERECPTFVQRLERLNAHAPSNWYRFFPTADPRTWELLDTPTASPASEFGPPASPPPPCSPPSPPARSLSQSTLGSIPVTAAKQSRARGPTASQSSSRSSNRSSAFNPPAPDAGWAGRSTKGKGKAPEVVDPRNRITAHFPRPSTAAPVTLDSLAEEGELPHTSASQLSDGSSSDFS